MYLFHIGIRIISAQHSFARSRGVSCSILMYLHLRGFKESSRIVLSLSLSIRMGIGFVGWTSHEQMVV